MKIKLGLGRSNMIEVAKYCGGELYDFTGEVGCEFEYVCTDSREADENTMFIATRGERVDGHDYIIKAIDSGCRCILCEYVPTNISGRRAAFVVVENSMDSFAYVARGYRADTKLKTVAITGSVGKTTTKELTAHILRERYKVYSTVGNYNSVIGMPMSLMEAEGDCQAAVFEMGMSSFGEIHSMSVCASPDVAMVINVGSSHLEYLKTRENIAKAKLEIADGLGEGGYLLLNHDEPLLRDYTGNPKCNVFYIGSDNRDECDVFIYNIRINENTTEFDLDCFGNVYRDLRINLIGKHFAYNAAFAAAASMLLGCDEDSVRDGLVSYIPEGLRHNISVKDKVTVIADCYNAAPESVRAAIDTLRHLSVKGKRVAVLGDMRELGNNSDNLHREVGGYLAVSGIDCLVTVGDSGALIAEGALQSGMSRDKVFILKDREDVDAAASTVSSVINEGDAVLFKASRALRLERIIERIFEKSFDK